MGIRRQIAGSDIILAIDPNGGTNYYLVVCLTSNSLERTTAVIDAGSKCGPELLPGVQSISMPFAFNDVFDTNNGEISESALHPLWASSATISWKFGPLVAAEGDCTYTGLGYISDLKTTAANNQQVQTTATISVQGSITQTITAS
jgi:hypothetical protein